MRRTKSHYEAILDKGEELILAGKMEHSIQALADLYEMQHATLWQGFNRSGLLDRWKALRPELQDDVETEDDDEMGKAVIHEVTENERIVSAKGMSIVTTLEELLDVCEVDLDVWAVDRHIVNTWGVTIKRKDGTPQQLTNFQVKAWLVRKKLVAVQAPIVPVLWPSVPKLVKPTPLTHAVHKALVVFDPHIGFLKNTNTGTLTPMHDRRVLDIARQVIKDQNINRVIGGGDWLDLAAFSAFTTFPEYRYTTQASLIEGRFWIEQLGMDEMLSGNHDDRPAKAIHKSNLQEAYNLRRVDQLDLPPVLSIEYLMGLDDLGVEYHPQYPDGEIWLNPWLRVIHSPIARSKPGHTASALVEKSHVSTMFGHVHKEETASLRKREGRDDWYHVKAYSPGCACHIDGRIPGADRWRNWQQGLGVAEYREDSPLVTLHNVPVHEGVGIFGGKEYYADEQSLDKELDGFLDQAFRQIDEAYL